MKNLKNLAYTTVILNVLYQQKNNQANQFDEIINSVIFLGCLLV